MRHPQAWNRVNLLLHLEVLCSDVEGQKMFETIQTARDGREDPRLEYKT
jgi:hypothetical protein